MRPNGAFRLSKESKRILARKINSKDCNDTKRAFINAELSSQQIVRREKEGSLNSFMLFTKTIEPLGQGLWYLPQVFDITTYRRARRCYRETKTGWQNLYPNRLMSLPNNPDYTDLRLIALDIAPTISEVVGFNVIPLNQEIFIDLPGHQLSWHFDNNNYKVLLQVYCGDLPKQNMGTQWYVGPKNTELLAKYGTDQIVDVTNLEIVETPYAPNAGYINDNTQKKAHGTKKVTAGMVRESILFTFN